MSNISRPHACAHDRHYAALHCEAKFLAILRTLKVEESNLAASCPKGH